MARALSHRHTVLPRKSVSRRPPLPMPEVLFEQDPGPHVVRVAPRKVIALRGAGDPNSEKFQKSVRAIYGAAYGLKFARRAEHASRDFRVGPLEARWWAEGQELPLFAVPHRADWRWELRLGIPDDVREEEVRDVVISAAHKQGGALAGSTEVLDVQLLELPAQTVGRILHLGPYADEPSSFDKVRAALVDAGLRPAYSHVEVYLSDPRRVAPAKLKTVLLLESIR